MAETQRRLKVWVVLASLAAGAWGCWKGFTYWFHHGGQLNEPFVMWVREYMPGYMLAEAGDPVSKHIMGESVWSSFCFGSLCFLVVLFIGLAILRARRKRQDL
ncbi:MAG: hypothetical protein KQH53_10205 [Desulfarculaceae bacterium]|nr:hypothetical protein [Desulfarculaceae bacterium]